MQYINTDSKAFGVCNICKKSVFGKLDKGSDTVFLEGKNAGRVGDKVKADCGHSGFINSGSSILYINGKPAADLTSSIVGDFIGRFIKGTSTIQ
jgi:uncharacterized Zn-binding protein involved in type VI secretion